MAIAPMLERLLDILDSLPDRQWEVVQWLVDGLGADRAGGARWPTGKPIDGWRYAYTGRGFSWQDPRLDWREPADPKVTGALRALRARGLADFDGSCWRATDTAVDVVGLCDSCADAITHRHAVDPAVRERALAF